MRDDDKASPEDERPEARPGRTRWLMLAAVLMVSLAAGTAVGLMVVGPRVAAVPPTAESGDAGATTKGKGGARSDINLHSIESLVVNPANTSGTRFLIVSIVVELEDAKSAETLKLHDAAVRDVLLHVLGAKSVEEMSNVALREGLKDELSAAMLNTVPGVRVRRVFLPQFVLQ